MTIRPVSESGSVPHRRVSFCKKLMAVAGGAMVLWARMAGAFYAPYTTPPFGVVVQDHNVHAITGVYPECRTGDGSAQVNCSSLPAHLQRFVEERCRRSEASHIQFDEFMFDDEGDYNGTAGAPSLLERNVVQYDVSDKDAQKINAPRLGLKHCYHRRQQKYVPCGDYLDNPTLRKWFEKLPIPGKIQVYYLGQKVLSTAQAFLDGKNNVMILPTGESPPVSE